MKGNIGSQAPIAYINLFLLLLPVLLGTIVALAKPKKIVDWTDRMGRWAINKREDVQDKAGKLYRYLIRPFLWGMVKIDGWTANIKGEYLRSGVRLGAYMYFASAFAILVIYATMLIAVIVIFFIMLWFVFYVLDSEFGKKNGYSVRKQSIFGNDYTEHYDDSEKKVGTSEVKERLFGGQYVQHYDKEGNRAGQSEEKDRIFGGNYTQHYDELGEKIGISEEKERIFGDRYSQHYDREGTQTGWSEKKETFFGDQYIEHHDDKKKSKDK